MKLITNIYNIALLNLCLVLAKPMEDILSDVNAETEGALSEIPIDADESSYNLDVINDDDSHEDTRFAIDSDFAPVWMENNGNNPAKVPAPPGSSAKSKGQCYNILSADSLNKICDGKKCLSVNWKYWSPNSSLLKFVHDPDEHDEFVLLFRYCSKGKNYYSIHHKRHHAYVFDVWKVDGQIQGSQPVVLYNEYHGGMNQLWVVERQGSHYLIESAANSNFVVDRDRTNDETIIYTYHRGGFDNQWFTSN